MSSPAQFSPPAKQSGGHSGQMLAIVLLSVGVVSSLCCLGFCGGGFLVFRSSGKSINQVAQSIQQQMPVSISSPTPGWAEDWMVMEMLAKAYTKSLDAVAADKQVIERLGEPIEATSDSDKLFRRERSGTLSPIGEDEKFEFDISGPKGTAVVHVMSNMARQGPTALPASLYSPEGFQPLKITVKFEDGSAIEVKPPQEESEPQP